MAIIKHLVCFFCYFFLFPAHAHIKELLIQKAAAREDFWERILTTQPTPLPGGQIHKPVHFYGDLIFSVSSDPNSIRDRQARHVQPVKIPESSGPSSLVHYHAYMSQSVYNNPQLLKGIVIKAYGAMIRNKFQRATIISDERLLAAQGYLVYTLNVRGTRGYGRHFLHSIVNQDGVFTQIRDICYFATLVRNRSIRDADKKRPAFSFKIPENTPIIFKGESYGGEVGLLIATTREAWPVGKLSICPATSFDGIISGCAVSEQYLDLCSLMTASKNRHAHFDKQDLQPQYTNVEWLPNCYPGVNLLNDRAANEKYSPIYRSHQLMRPILLTHGMLDTNVSPINALLFQDAVYKAGKEHLLFPYYDFEEDHNMPTSEERLMPYYEAIFRFLDLQKILKDCHHTLQPGDHDLSGIYRTAYSKFRARNPDAYHPDYKFIDVAYTQLVEKGLYPSDYSYNSLWTHVINTHWHLYLQSILFLHVLDAFKIENKIAIERLPEQEGFSLITTFKLLLDEVRIGDSKDAYQKISCLEDFFDAYSPDDGETGKDLLYKCLSKGNQGSDPLKTFKKLEGQLKSRFFTHLNDTSPHKFRHRLSAPLLDF